MGPYVVDFLVPEAGLVIEVDGGVHRGREKEDAARDAFLAAQGLRVLRLDAALVMRELPEAVARVRAAMRA